MTQAEKVLWEGLRKGRLDGLHFRKQHPIHRFILDFFCAPLKLCVEVDGSVHEQQRERDEERTTHLAARGITVLRFTNDEVLNDRASVLRRIRMEARRLAAMDAPEV
jgi:very-short-patch-repair endonuclease